MSRKPETALLGHSAPEYKRGVRQLDEWRLDCETRRLDARYEAFCERMGMREAREKLREIESRTSSERKRERKAKRREAMIAAALASIPD